MPLEIFFELGFRSEIFTSAHALSQSGGEDYRSMEKSRLIDVISVQRDIFCEHNVTSNHRQTGVNVLCLLNRFSISSLKCWTVNFCTHASEGPDIIMN